MFNVRIGIRPVIFVLAVAVTVLAYESAEAQRKGGGRGFGRRTVSMVSLVQDEKVQEELKITDEQREEIEKIADAYRGDMEDLNAGLEDLSAEERQKKQAELAPERDKIVVDAEKKLAGVLKEDQVTRLRGITIQAIGIHALVRSDVAESLKLSDEQKKKIKDLIDSELTRMAPPSPGAGAGSDKKGDKEGEKGERRGGFDQIRAKMAEIRKQNEAEVKNILTADQQKQLEDLKGAAFELPARPGRFRRGEKKSE